MEFVGTQPVGLLVCVFAHFGWTDIYIDIKWTFKYCVCLQNSLFVLLFIFNTQYFCHEKTIIRQHQVSLVKGLYY